MSDQASDSSLIARTRRGDMGAYEELYRRHVDDAAKVARIVTDNAEDAPELVNEAFTRILTRLSEGGGPEDDLGPYLRTIVRRLAVDRHRGHARTPTADPDTLDVLPTTDDPIGRADTTYLVRTAFETLPERWQQVLWHTEIEGRSPASLASMLDVAPNAVAALAYRAREGLRQAYLSVNLPREVRAECRSYTQKLPAYTRGTLSGTATEEMSDHLSTCADCRDRRDELLLLTSDLRGLLVPALLLPAAAGAGAAAAGAGAAAGGGVLAWLSPTTWAKNPGAAGGVAAGVAVVAVATALALTSGDEEPVAGPSNDAPPAESADPPPPADEPADPPADEPADPPADEPEPPADEPADPPADEPEPPAEEPEPDPAAPSIEVDLDTDVAVDDGGSVRLSVQVAGYPEPDLQWQRQAPPDSAEARVATAMAAVASLFAAPDSVPAGTTVEAATSDGVATDDINANAEVGWADIDGATSAEFVIPETTWRQDGESYRVVATNESGSLTSSAASLNVQYEPMVIADPGIDGPVDAGDPVTLSASVRGNPVPDADDVTWERRGPAGSWEPLEADTSVTGTGRRTVEMTASFAADVPDHKARFRAVVDNGQGDPVATVPAEAVIHWAPTIADAPSDSTAALGNTATIEAAVSGNPLDAEDVQWEQRDPGTGQWKPADGDTVLTGNLDRVDGATSTLTVDAKSKSLNETRYRVVATADEDESVVSDPADLAVTWPTEILRDPEAAEHDEGGTASFTATFSSSPFDPGEARWQYREPGDSWTDVDAESSLDGDPATEEGATSTLTVAADRAHDAREYRFHTGDTTTDSAELTVHWEPEVTDEPVESLDVEWRSDATISATVDADHDTELVWQRRTGKSGSWEAVPDQPEPERIDHHWESTLPVADEFQNARYRLVARHSEKESLTTRETQVTIVATGTLRTDLDGRTYCVGTTTSSQGSERAALVDCADATVLTRRPGSDYLADERRHGIDSGDDERARCLTAHLLEKHHKRVIQHPVSMMNCDDEPWLASMSWASDAFPAANRHEPTTEEPELVYLKHFGWRHSTKCLDVENNDAAIDAHKRLVIEHCRAGENQLFRFVR